LYPSLVDFLSIEEIAVAADGIVVIAAAALLKLSLCWQQLRQGG
jgi:hypothetical protein